MKKVRYGVIGIKGVGKRHIKTALENENIELVALADIDSDVVVEKARHLGIQAFTDYRDLLSAGMVDAVSIATPHYLHATMSLDCLHAGAHIFKEKPLAIRVSEADQLIQAAGARNLKICVAHQYRLHRSSKVTKELIDTGALGNIMQVLWTWHQFRPETYYTRWPWRADFERAGSGVLINNVSHDLDLICWLFGQPVEVNAMLGNQLHTAQIEDIAFANMLFANGALGAFQSSLNRQHGYSVRQIAGDKGVLLFPDVKSLTRDENDKLLLGRYPDSLTKLVSKDSAPSAQPPIDWQQIILPGDESYIRKLTNPKKVMQKLGLLPKAKLLSPHSVLMQSFVDAIIDGGQPLVNAENTRPVIELINAIILSAFTKKTVNLPIKPDEYDELFEQISQGATRIPSLGNFFNGAEKILKERELSLENNCR